MDCHEVYRRSESSNKSAVTTLKQIIQDSKRIVSDLEHGPDLHQGMLLDIHKEFEPQVSKIKEKHENIKDIIENHLNFKNDDSPLKNNLILEIFPEEIRQQNDFNFFVKKTFPELKRRENLQPFEIAQLPFEKRNIRYLTTLKQWLRKVEFFTHFPDLIIQRVWDWIVPEKFKKGDLVMKQGDTSCFMAIIWRGEIGVYLNIDYNNSSNFEELIATVKPVANKHKYDIVGEKGLLKESKRGASCIALADTDLFTITVKDYAYIIEGFHRVELQKNISYMSELTFFKYISYLKIEQLAKSFNSKHLNKSEVLVKEGSKVDQMFILRDGQLDVQKVIKIEFANYWPIKSNQWEWNRKNQNFNKSVFNIIQGQFFGLYEWITQISIPSSIIAQTDSVSLLCINRSDILQIFSQDEIKYLLDSPYCVKIPEQSEMVKKAVVDCKAESIRARAMREISNSVTREYWGHRDLSLPGVENKRSLEIPKSRTASEKRRLKDSSSKGSNFKQKMSIFRWNVKKQSTFRIPSKKLKSSERKLWKDKVRNMHRNSVIGKKMNMRIVDRSIREYSNSVISRSNSKNKLSLEKYR